MSTSLVIVESPAKARTIGRYLGDDFVVEASIGAVRDLDPKGLAVDIEADFKPSYVVPPDKHQVVKRLRTALGKADALYLATDEDREGEAIAWHLTEVLKPGVPVRRMVFHEITQQAIEAAIASPRDIDQGLVDAQEARRIVDRLFGYPVSEVLWRKISRGLSAGRVQSPAVRLVVERERERMDFVAADYWGLEATFPTDPSFVASLVKLGAARVATGKDFNSNGRLERSQTVALDEASSDAIMRGLGLGVHNGGDDKASAGDSRAASASFTVASVDEKPYRSSPKAPFITSTLQQEGGRKLNMSSRQVMRTAQGLYERGYITYMRTDSTTLSDEAVGAARGQIAEMYGPSYVPERPRVYRSKVRNAQEAHEAIRPSGERWRIPRQLQAELSGTELRLYELIWKRTLASQMADATGQTLAVRIEASIPAETLAGTPAAAAADLNGKTDENATTDTVRSEWTASGRTIMFPGYLRVYVEGSDDPEADLDDRERPLPALVGGQLLPSPILEANSHRTQPPPRYTEASLVRRLEELGIGRPSTYASIMQTIQDRGYVWRRGQALVPSWTAFAVVNLLEGHFSAEVDYSFTARMEQNLDEIAVGRGQRGPFLHEFWFGDRRGAPSGERTDEQTSSDPRDDGGVGAAGRGAEPDDTGVVGLTTLIDLAMANADPAVVNAIPLGKDPDGAELEVRNGRYGPFVRRGDETASVPQDVAPDELTVERALELLAAPKGEEPIGTDPASGLPVYVKTGRYGPYVQLGDADTLPHDAKPKMASLFRSMSPSDITVDDALRLLSLPRLVGTDPDSGEEITAQNGRYGPYLRKGTDSRSLADEEEIFTVTLDEALGLFAQPKRRGRVSAATPLKELGTDPTSGKPVTVRNGRYGPYVTDGETNASLRERDGDTVDGITLERAAELLQGRRAAGPSSRRGRPRATKKKAATKAKTATKTKAATKKKTAARTKRSTARTTKSPRGS